MRIVILLIFSCSFCAAQNIRLIIDPPAMQVSKGYQRFKVHVANDSDKPITIIKPTHPLEFNSAKPKIIGVASDPYIAKFSHVNNCMESSSRFRHMLSASLDLVSILPGEVRELGELENHNLFDCLKADSSYTFTLTYHPVVTLGVLPASEKEKIEKLKARLRSINERIYNLGLYKGYASTGYTITELDGYLSYYSEVLSRIAPVTLTSNTVTITK